MAADRLGWAHGRCWVNWGTGFEWVVGFGLGAFGFAWWVTVWLWSLGHIGFVLVVFQWHQVVGLALGVGVRVRVRLNMTILLLKNNLTSYLYKPSNIISYSILYIYFTSIIPYCYFSFYPCFPS